MMEYRVMLTGTLVAEIDLNNMAREGWRFVGSYFDQEGRMRLILERRASRKRRRKPKESPRG